MEIKLTISFLHLCNDGHIFEFDKRPDWQHEFTLASGSGGPF